MSSEPESVLDLRRVARETVGDHPRLTELPSHLHLGPQAAEGMAADLQGVAAGTVAVLRDARTGPAAGPSPLEALRRHFQVEIVEVPDPQGGSPVCDDVTQVRLQGRIGQVDALVAIGSGVLSDLAKWIAFERGIPYAVHATAASMNGYAAANVAPTIAGLKTLVPARAAVSLSADPAVLAAAPARLTAAGFGDLLAKRTSTIDWRLGELVGGEPFLPALAALPDRAAAYLDRPEALAAGDAEATASLFTALVLSGAGMTLFGSSLPASGGEHMISHALDMLAGAVGGAHDLHGRQVGVATIFAAALLERVLAAPARDAAPTLDAGPLAALAGAETARKRLRLVALAEAVGRLGGDLAARLGPAPSPGSIRDLLRRAGAAASLADIGVSRERFLLAVGVAPALRSRLTILDLALVRGVPPEVAAEIVGEWLE